MESAKQSSEEIPEARVVKAYKQWADEVEASIPSYRQIRLSETQLLEAWRQIESEERIKIIEGFQKGFIVSCEETWPAAEAAIEAIRRGQIDPAIQNLLLRRTRPPQ